MTQAHRYFMGHLDEYLLTYTTLSDKLERLDKRIEVLAYKDE